MRIVPEEPTTTKVLFPYATALRLFEVPEVCAVQFAPSDEVSKVPSAPTAINNPLDVVVVLSVVVLLVLLVSLFLAQEMTVRLKSDIRITCKIFYILSSKYIDYIANLKSHIFIFWNQKL